MATFDMTIPHDDMENIIKSIQGLIGLPFIVGSTLVDEIQDNSSELELKFRRPDVSVRSVAYQQGVESVRQRTLVAGKSNVKVSQISTKILDDTEQVAQRIASTLRMYVGLKVAVA